MKGKQEIHGSAMTTHEKGKTRTTPVERK